MVAHINHIRAVAGVEHVGIGEMLHPCQYLFHQAATTME